ncbi:MAG: ABC transporter ATP-binding protein/permease [Acidobacteriia bacterium]|nr:ABC transporter ATP-binding protein/permease [Terriglobia bacterium]
MRLANPNDKNPTDKKKKSSAQHLKSALPLIRELIRPRRGLLALSFGVLVIGRLAGLVLPASTKYLIDDVIGKHRSDMLLPLVAVVITATLIQGVSSFSMTQLLSKEAQRLITEMRRRVQEHVGRLSLSYYDANKTGALVSRIMNDVEGVRNLIGTGLVEFCGGVLTAVLALGFLLRINARMTVVALSFLVALMVALGRAFKVIRPIFRERSKISAEVTGRLTESLGGVRVVKGYHAEEREAQVFATGAQRLLDNVLKTLTATSLMGLSSTVMIGIVSSIIMYFGASQVLGGHMTTGGLFSYTMFIGFLIAPVAQIAAIGTQITEALAGLDRTREVLNEAREDQDPQRTLILPEPIQGEIAFEHVDFSYEPGKPVLDDVSFSSRPGTVTALVGSSGSGKSTMIGLVAAFYKPTSGRVLVDGVDLSQVRLSSYRGALGVVLQDSFLFDGSIRENIAFSRPDATEDQIMQACRIAHVDEFAERFPEKYATIIGERGVKLSGGQKQRVSIARAVLADPRILILDEATSSLDSESEAYIQQGLKYLMEGRTTFVIAHRLSTIRQADQILVVEAGKIVERGKHEHLLALKGRYHDLYMRQHGLETNLFLAPGEGDKVEEATASGRGGAGDPDAISLIRGGGSSL